MRVTFTTYDDPGFVGGPNSWLRRLLPALAARGLQPEVLVFRNGPPDARYPLVEALQSDAIPVAMAPWEGGTRRKVRWLLRRLSDSRPAVFVPNLITAAFVAARWVRAAGIPTVSVLHSDDAFYRGVVNAFVVGPAPDRLDALVCVSDFLLRFAAASGPTTTGLRRIAYGVPVPPLVDPPPDDVFRIVWLGRLVQEQKAVREVAHALCRATARVPGTHAVLYGDGPERPAVEEILRREGGGRVEYGGRVPNTEMPSRLAGFHAVALLSDYEGLPIAILEAMACGVVPICLDVRSGVPELIEDGVTGFRVRDREGSFLAAVSRLAGDRALWRRMRLACRDHIEAHYTLAREADAWAALLRELTSGRQSTPLRAPLVVPLPPLASELAQQDRSLATRAWRRLRRSLETAP